jgi:hypothetical protein
MNPETNPHTPLLFGPKTQAGDEIEFMIERSRSKVVVYLREFKSRVFIVSKRSGVYLPVFKLVHCTINDELAPQPYTIWEKDAEIARLRGGLEHYAQSDTVISQKFNDEGRLLFEIVCSKGRVAREALAKTK